MSSESVLRKKLFWIGVLYFAEGFPLGVFYEVLPVNFRQQGVNLSDIGFLSLLGLAWSIKFLWAPAIDRYRHHRRWMFTVDMGMAAIMLLLAIYSDFGTWMWLAIAAFTLLSATNDIAIDAYSIELLDKREFGLANGVRIALYRAAMLFSGGLLILEQWIGWSGVFMVCAATIAVMGIVSTRAPRELPGGGRAASSARDELRGLIAHPSVFLPAVLLILALLVALSRTLLRLSDVPILLQAANYTVHVSIALLALAALVGFANRDRGTLEENAELTKGPIFGAFLSMASRRYFFPVVLFILTFKLADQTIGFMIKPFWVDAGFSTAQIGTVSVNIGLALSIAGGLAGGWFTDRYGVFNGLWILGLTQIFSNLGYAGIAYAFPLPGEVIVHPTSHLVMMYSASAVESFTQGLGTGAFMAFLMSIVHKKNAATEFAVLSSVFTLARSLAGWAGGFGAEAWGYGPFFLTTFFFGLPAYLLLPWVRKMLNDADAMHQRAAAAQPKS